MDVMWQGHVEGLVLLWGPEGACCLGCQILEGLPFDDEGVGWRLAPWGPIGEYGGFLDGAG